MGFLASMIDDVEITQLGDSKYSGELIKIVFKDGQIRFINTSTNVISTSYNMALNKLVSNCKLQNGRLHTVMRFDQYPNGTRFQLGLIVILAYEHYIGIKRNSYADLEVNHKDRSGSIKVLGYINNCIYNLELVNGGNNKRHWRLIDYIKKELGIQVAFSADNTELMDLLEFTKNDDKTVDLQLLKNDILEHISFHDEHVVTYLK
jgi:hypothetical protein